MLKITTKDGRLPCQMSLGNDDRHLADVILLTESLKGKFIWNMLFFKSGHVVKSGNWFWNSCENKSKEYFFILEIWYSKVFEKHSLPDLGITHRLKCSVWNFMLDNFSSQKPYVSLISASIWVIETLGECF